MHLDLLSVNGYKCIICPLNGNKVPTFLCHRCTNYSDTGSRYLLCKYEKENNLLDIEKIIFVSAPYSGNNISEIETHVQEAIDIGIKLYQKGYIPVIPHLLHYFDLRAKELGLDINYEEFMKIDDIYLQTCHYYLQHKPSPGADRELARARELDKIIFYSIDEVPDLNLFHQH